jgi:hypothetical protein
MGGTSGVRRFNLEYLAVRRNLTEYLHSPYREQLAGERLRQEYDAPASMPAHSAWGGDLFLTCSSCCAEQHHRQICAYFHWNSMNLPPPVHTA